MHIQQWSLMNVEVGSRLMSGRLRPRYLVFQDCRAQQLNMKMQRALYGPSTFGAFLPGLASNSNFEPATRVCIFFYYFIIYYFIFLGRIETASFMVAVCGNFKRRVPSQSFGTPCCRGEGCSSCRRLQLSLDGYLVVVVVFKGYASLVVNPLNDSSLETKLLLRILKSISLFYLSYCC